MIILILSKCLLAFVLKENNNTKKKDKRRKMILFKHIKSFEKGIAVFN